MNALDLLRNQHREIEAMFEKIKEERDGRTKKQIVSQLASMIRGHTAIEEKLFYPASQKALTGDEEGQEKVLEFYEEHSLVTVAMETLAKTPVNDKRWMARCKVLEELFHNHTQEEEQDLFPRMEDEMGAEELERLGAQLERRYETTSRATKKRAAKRAPAKRAPARAATKRAATKRGATKRAAPKRAATKRAATKRGATKRATTKRAASPTTTRRAASRSASTTKRRGTATQAGSKRGARGRGRSSSSE